ncbi:MAG: Maf family nucleotide pyrophosphatase [Bacteroidales bacterium]|nr:Maf family nucleotide pyrophosphatase [Bacteroidales bacterium]
MLSNLKNCKLLLASKSPRRKQLLQDAGFVFEVVNSKETKENIPEDILNEDAAVYLAELKANAYKDELKDKHILIASDTIVCLENKILGKPKDYKEAFEMIKSLSGKKHKVITGVSIISINKEVSFSSITYVYFKNISDEEIKFYIENFKPYDKAGAYGIQEWIGLTCIEKIEGSYFNVMGLPVQKLYESLKSF